ncbi:MAG: hypothetical protein WBR18_11680 [Anaerolineales bacterium]
MNVSSRGRPLPNILEGHDEPIFDHLPANVLDNFRRSSSENALVWNLLYPLARPTLSLRALLQVRPLWGSAGLGFADDSLTPYYWGHGLDGQALEPLTHAVAHVDGDGPSTEVDVVLIGHQNLVLVEAKNRSRLGRCSRYQSGACPEVHSGGRASSCRYWSLAEARFDQALVFEPPVSSSSPDCNRHYQLARTMLIGRRLAERLELRFHLWLICPRRHWRSLERDWVDFADKIIDSDEWRRLRVLSWEDVAALSDR